MRQSGASGASGARTHVHVRRAGLRVDEETRQRKGVVTFLEVTPVRRLYVASFSSSSPRAFLFFNLSFPFRARIRSHDVTELERDNRVSLSGCVIERKKKIGVYFELSLPRN